MPWLTSKAEYSPVGRPKRRHCAVTTSMSSRTRNSRATIPTTSVLPPCELAMTILRRPARYTPSPISTQLRTRFSAEWVMVPPERKCSLDFPMVWIGRNSTRRSSGRRASTVSIRPSAIALSVMTGRCGPCCSVEATGRIATVELGSSPANSLDLSSAQNRLVMSNPAVPIDAVSDALAPSAWYSKSPGHPCKRRAIGRQSDVCPHATPDAIRPPFARYGCSIEIPPRPAFWCAPVSSASPQHLLAIRNSRKRESRSSPFRGNHCLQGGRNMLYHAAVDAPRAERGEHERGALAVERNAMQRGRRAAEHDGARLATHARASHRNQGRLRGGRLRRLHHRPRSAHRRIVAVPRGEFLPDDAAADRQLRGAHGRGFGGSGRDAPSGATGARRCRRHPVRLLHAGLRDGDVRFPPRRRAGRHRDRARSPRRQPLPLHRFPPDRGGLPAHCAWTGRSLRWRIARAR